MAAQGNQKVKRGKQKLTYVHRFLKNCKANCPKQRATLAGQWLTNCPHNRDLDRE
jgi:hypothetical protein